MNTPKIGRSKAVKKNLVKYLVVSYDDDQQQWFYDLVYAKTAEDASAFICKMRDYVIAADATEPKNLDFNHVGAFDATQEISECQNCEAKFPQNRLKPIKDLAQRVVAGESMPSGECPECGALCQVIA
jgi:hypothetical protein